MVVCPQCTIYGKVVESKKEIVRQKVSIQKRKILSKVEDEIFKSMKKVLVPDWNERIRRARERKGLTREELGSKVGEPTVAIAKMENRELRPSDETIKKLEKILDITLLQDVEEIRMQPAGARTALTLGDFIKMEKNEEE